MNKYRVHFKDGTSTLVYAVTESEAVFKACSCRPQSDVLRVSYE